MFEMMPRQGLVVWVYSLKQLKTLRRYGTVIYVSRKMKYVYLYLDAALLEETMVKIKKLRFVKHVEPSYRPLLDMDFGGRVGQFAPTEEDVAAKAKKVSHQPTATKTRSDQPAHGGVSHARH